MSIQDSSTKRVGIFLRPGEGNTVKPMFETVSTGITTALNVGAGIPAIVGTMASGLSDGELC